MALKNYCHLLLGVIMVLGIVFFFNIPYISSVLEILQKNVWMK